MATVRRSFLIPLARSHAPLLVMIVVLACPCVEQAIAQNPPARFFEKDYAKVLPNGRGPADPRAPTPFDRAGGMRDMARATGTIGVETQSASARQAGDPQAPMVASLAGMRIPPMVMLVVNSKDEAHLNTVIKKALSLVSSQAIFMSAIFHIGDYRTLSPTHKEMLQRLTIMYVPAAMAPFVQDARVSPTWVFFTKDGIRVVEGVMNVEKFIAASGEYRDPEKVDAVSAPTDKLAGF